jgi:enediyne polyketide synthase
VTQSTIAVVGLACRYPDACSPEELWRNVLAGRRAFRRLPDERMRHEDYYDADPAVPDRFYANQAAVIEGFEFDRVKYRVAGSTFRSTDMTHWLALDTAARALEAAGFPAAEGLSGLNTGVVVGNSLTGEFSRANLMRLRWPYVRRTVASALREQGWDDDALGEFLDGLEQRYKQPFPAIDEDTLAGGLANTIAGRICNHFDFKGGGYTVDGACSSSLLAVATACNALASGQLDVAIAGGVDLSIDPFEVIGFAKTGALAKSEMRVYDRRSNGFWPGEGCGMVVLTRDDIARDLGLFRHATIAGWGYSSDGKGGITRPEASGHRLALQRAYAVAGFGIDTVGYLEGHGTGTAVGDATELQALSEERRAADPAAPPVAIGTVKGNIGHTKAAAGVAGLLKAIMAVRHQTIPPATSHFEPHAALTGDRPALRVPDQAELWPAGVPARAGVSSMGFGGINAHIVVERADGARRTKLSRSTTRIVRSRQDAELLMLDGTDAAELRGRIQQLATMCGKLSYAELGDLAATLQGDLSGRPLRAAIVASAPAQAKARFEKLLALLESGATSVLNTFDDVYLGRATKAPRIGFLFPGPGAGRRGGGGALRRRFASVDDLYQGRDLPAAADLVDTAVAQPRIVTASVAGLRVLSELGITAVGAAGHSLGELTALHWAGSMTEAAVLDLAAARGRIMSDASDGDGTMAGIAAPPDVVAPLLVGTEVVIAGYNGPKQTVVSGRRDAVASVSAKATAQGVDVSAIAVSHAFHSKAVAPAADAFEERLAGEQFLPMSGRVFSTVTGAELSADVDVRALLTRQIVEPVQFAGAAQALAEQVDLLLEVGPGGILSGLAAQVAPGVPAISLGTDSPSLAGLLRAVAAAFTLGAPIRHGALFSDRFTRPLALTKELRFFASPCESAPDEPAMQRERAVSEPVGATEAVTPTAESSLAVLLRLAAARAELPVEAVHAESNPLDELHLSSITVGQIVNQAARELGITAPLAASAFATSTLGQLAAMLDELAAGRPAEPDEPHAVRGVAPWTRAFSIDLVPTPPVAVGVRPGLGGQWRLFAPERHPIARKLLDAMWLAELGDGILLCLPRDCDERHVPLMLEAAHAALATSGATRFVAVGDRRSAAALAKTLHLEAPHITTTVVSLPLPEVMSEDQVTATIARIVGDVAATTLFAEIVYDEAGVRHVPVLRPLPDDQPDEPANTLGAADVLLVTGGGKGITYECALALGNESGAALGLLGRSDPATDPELAANLARMAAAGIRFRYVRADVTSAPDVKDAVNEIREAYGEVTAVLHGAGRNEPGELARLGTDKVTRTLAPKIAGLEAVLAATDPTKLRLLVSFSSIIGRAGLKGEGDYALANDWLTILTRQVQDENPSCRSMSLEWSVWSGSGMGERLGVVDALARDGVEPIPTEQGVALLSQLIADPRTPSAVVVMGRAEGLPTVTLHRPELPLQRFIERPMIHYPGIELVADTELSAAADLYLSDHLLDGDLLFPAVLGMEAMAQVAAALTGRGGNTVLEDVEFLRPIVVPVDGATTIRVAALVTGPDTVQTVIRSSESGFQAEHFRASVRCGVRLPQETPPQPPGRSGEWLPVQPDQDLYGPVLFQGDRFQRLVGYRQLAATSCIAEIATGSAVQWFAGFLPDTLLTGDPGARDAFMHSLQCCVPDATLLPAGIERLYLAEPAPGRTHLTMHAAERLRDGDTYVYDLDVRDDAGTLVEHWQGLRLRAVRKQDGSGPWVPALLGPYLERRTEPMLSRNLRCVVWPDDGQSRSPEQWRERAREAIRWALGPDAVVQSRSDGTLEVDRWTSVAHSHGAGVMLAVLGDRPVGCDVAIAGGRSDREWAELLGPAGSSLAKQLSVGSGESYAVAATRVLGALRCVRSVGGSGTDLEITSVGPHDRWVRLQAGAARIATFQTALRGQPDPVVFTMLTEVGE